MEDLVTRRASASASRSALLVTRDTLRNDIIPKLLLTSESDSHSVDDLETWYKETKSAPKDRVAEARTQERSELESHRNKLTEATEATSRLKVVEEQHIRLRAPVKQNSVRLQSVLESELSVFLKVVAPFLDGDKVLDVVDSVFPQTVRRPPRPLLAEPTRITKTKGTITAKHRQGPRFITAKFQDSKSKRHARGDGCNELLNPRSTVSPGSSCISSMPDRTRLDQSTALIELQNKRSLPEKAYNKFQVAFDITNLEIMCMQELGTNISQSDESYLLHQTNDAITVSIPHHRQGSCMVLADIFDTHPNRPIHPYLDAYMNMLVHIAEASKSGRRPHLNHNLLTHVPWLQARFESTTNNHDTHILSKFLRLMLGTI
ncbi:hypothetical protein BTUL_0190g00080 [Botrytis tulipae]|uniref:Uncharacterized protein n=1 Tax=Botrytis tulipae TaxID=87230 RepID=A0A4Z1E9D8_9HELO|nr:hypothetical protein BTUL_0190g00080 [Botrytis tulipae]